MSNVLLGSNFDEGSMRPLSGRTHKNNIMIGLTGGPAREA